MQDSKRDTDVQNGLLDSEGEGEGRMIWENGTETCITSYKRQFASPISMQDTGCLGLLHWDEGVSGLGTRVHPWWIHVDVWQNQYNIVK